MTAEDVIYFDNSATTKIFKEAADTMMATMDQYYGNPSSLHGLGDKAQALLKASRKQVAQLLGCQADEVFFTSGGTEGNNWVIKGTALEKADRGKHIIVSSVEHPSVHNVMLALERHGYEVTYLPVDSQGRVSPADLADAIRPDTILVSVMAVNNEVGTIQPIADIGDILEEYPAIHFHVDGVQSVGKLPTPLIHPRVDFMTFSAHKFNGPRGVGIVYKKRGRIIEQLLHGGGQEQNQRSSTENLPGIAATAKAMRMTYEHADREMANHRKIQARIRAFLGQYPDRVHIFSPEEEASPHILCLALKGVRGEVMVHALEDYGIYVSTTSACSSRSHVTSSTLSAMHVDGTLAEDAIRLSFGWQNTLEEADRFIQAYQELLNKFEKIE